MNSKQINAYNKQLIIVCDNKCEKAFGIHGRPTISFDEENMDDYAFLSDDEVGIAPIDPGNYEGGHAKPKNDSEKMNKWCFRECERCSAFDLGEEIKLIDFSVQVNNIRM
jgi:hypothetical protein